MANTSDENMLIKIMERSHKEKLNRLNEKKKKKKEWGVMISANEWAKRKTLSAYEKENN